MGFWSDLGIWLSGIGGGGGRRRRKRRRRRRTGEEEEKRREGICKKSNNPTLKGGELVNDAKTLRIHWRNQ